MATRERYVDIVHLPDGVSAANLPPEVRKYLINVDGTDAGADDGTESSGWVKTESGQWRYRKPDGTYVSNSWLTVDEKTYYMNAEGIMLADTITPDGIYVNAKGEKTNYLPGWVQDEKGWKYVMKNGAYTGSSWVQDSDGRYYHFNIGCYMEADMMTSDGYYVDVNGVWDGQPSTINNSKSLGPGVEQNAENPTDTQA